mgnify:CR=1 FL=1
MKKIKSYAAFMVCMSVFVLFFLTAFISPAKAEETYTVTIKYEPQQDDNGKVFSKISIIDKTSGQILRNWVMAETLEVEVENGHEIEVRFMMAPGNQFYGITRSDGWCGGTFTQGTASFDEAKGSQKFGFAGRGDSITDEDVINGWMTTQNSPVGYYYYYLSVNNDNTIYLLSYDNIQWFGMQGDEFIMNGGYVSKTTSTGDKEVITADYNTGPIQLDWSPKYIYKGIAHDEFKVGDLFGLGRIWGTKKDCIALYGGISDKKVVTYASDTTTAKSSVYEYPKSTIDAEWSLKNEGITRVDFVNTSPRGAVTTGQVLCKIYDNKVTITDYFTADSYPEGAFYDDETGYYKIVTTDYGGEYHSTYTADTAGVYDGYVIASNDGNKISVVICEGENYYKSDKNQIVRYWRPKTQNYTLYFDYNKPGEAAGDITGNEILSKPVIFNEAVGELPEPQLTGWLFIGWKNADGKIYTKETVYNVAGDTTLYAQWSRNIYTLYFDYNKPGEAAGDITGNEISSKPVTFNEMVGELPHPQLDKYTFLSWKDADGNIYTEDTVFVLSQDLTLYAFWDAAPVIHAIDRYYTLTSANNGRITRENLMSTASVTDDKDNLEDIEFKIADYSENDFKNLTADAQISITYKAVDSAGNKTYKKVFVHIVDTTPKKIEKTTYVRHISEKYYDKAFEDGGLEPDSIWRKNPEYAATLKRAMENRASITYARKYFRFLGRNFGYTDYGDMSVDHIEQHWEFTKEDRDKIRDFVNEHGIGNSKEPDALKKFYETFGYCRKY